MSHERNGQLHTFSCDSCGENEIEISSHDFNEAWEEAKSEGWRCFKNDDDEWEHRCPECRGE